MSTTSERVDGEHGHDALRGDIARRAAGDAIPWTHTKIARARAHARFASSRRTANRFAMSTELPKLNARLDEVDSLLELAGEPSPGDEALEALEQARALLAPKLKLARASIVRRRLCVYWPMDDAWYTGVVVGWDPKAGQHSVLYDDGCAPCAASACTHRQGRTRFSHATCLLAHAIALDALLTPVAPFLLVFARAQRDREHQPPDRVHPHLYR